MSDLNDFFAKKDRKKKKAATKSAIASSPTEGKKKPDNPAETSVAAPAPSQPDDGWIEIEDPKGAQVNTGGRTVVEFKRDAEDKEHNGDGNAPTEKFSGWAKAESGAQEGEEADGDKPAAAPAAPSTAFPSLADAADAPEVPVARRKPTTGSGYGSSSGRPRFINSNADKIRQKLAERSAAPAGK